MDNKTEELKGHKKYREAYPNKTDPEIIELLAWELSEKVQAIHRLLNEKEELNKHDIARQRKILVDFSDNVIWKDHRIHISTKAIEDYLKLTNRI